jgi:hypothetical protein
LRIGSALCLFELATVGGSISVLMESTVGCAASLFSFLRGSTASLFDNAGLGRDVSVFSHAELGSIEVLRSLRAWGEISSICHCDFMYLVSRYYFKRL